MAKTLTSWQLTNKIRKLLGADHPQSPFILSYLEKNGWVEQKEPYRYTLCPGILPTTADAHSIADQLNKLPKSKIQSI